ncbi:putative ATP-grasp-modified RiPP [Streptomyces sp. NPDC050560]|uniref:putative ATP-grasp-modified RiPP n=1 Tax=Streptomyces sp. NPDC050560 TaxID=3365630 RepID=UPI0037A9CEA9
MFDPSSASRAPSGTQRTEEKILQTSTSGVKTVAQAPWGLRRMAPLRNGTPSPWRYVGLDPVTQTGRWAGEDGGTAPAELGRHGTSVNTYPPTQVGKDGTVDADSGHDAEQDEGQG